MHNAHEITVTAQHNFLRMSPKKVNVVARFVVGLTVIESENQLKHVNKKAAEPVLKLLHSAIANAKNVYDVEKEQLYIKALKVDQGPTLSRWKPRAYGRATPIRKRSSHLMVVLGVHEKEGKEALAVQKKKDKLKQPTLVSDVRDVTRAASEEKVPDSNAGADITETEGRKAETALDTKSAGEHSEPKKAVSKKVARGYRRGFIKRIFARKTG